MEHTLKHLGEQSQEAVTEFDLIPWTGGQTVVTLECSEFTSHCPVTKQPDFGKLEISYCPDEHILETKSVKLFLWQYRSKADFNEVIVSQLADAVFAQAQPKWVTVVGHFNTRGGIAVTAMANREKE